MPTTTDSPNNEPQTTGSFNSNSNIIASPILVLIGLLYACPNGQYVTEINIYSAIDNAWEIFSGKVTCSAFR